MVKRFKKNNKEHVLNLLEFLKLHYAPDFYYTKDNQRFYIETQKHLNEFIKTCKDIWITDDEREIKGVAVIWVAKGGEVKRDYIKMAAKNATAADALLSVLLWNYDRETYVKVLKTSRHLNLFYKKGFKFLSSRGTQLLLKRDKHIFRNNIKKD